MTDLKKPSKIVVVRHFISTGSAGTSNLICFGTPIAADNKALKKFTNPYDKCAAYASARFRVADLEFDNEPVKGYQFVYTPIFSEKSLWYIMHPEGFRFPISLTRYRDIINSCTVINGQIQEGLFFDHNMQLTCEGSASFKKGIKEQKQEEKNKEVSSELTVGCTLIHKTDSKKRLIYCGKLHLLSNSSLSYLHLKSASSNCHVFYNEVEDTYCATLNATAGTYTVSTSMLKKIDINEVLDKCNLQIKNKIPFYDYKFFSSAVSSPILASIKKITVGKNLKFEYTDVSKQDLITVEISRSAATEMISLDVGYPYIAEKDGVTYFVLGLEGTVDNWRYTSREVNEKFKYSEKENYGVWGYPVTLDENGVVKWDIDVSKHRRMSWSSIFTQTNNHKSLHTMHFLGYLDSGKIQIKVGEPKEIK